MKRDPSSSTAAQGGRVLRQEQRRWYDADQHPLMIGCSICPDRAACGGLRNATGGFSCLDDCCGGRVECDTVCPRNPSYVNRVREVRGFELATIGRAPTAPLCPLPEVVPVLYSGAYRIRYNGPAVVLSIYKLLQRGGGEIRFDGIEALAKEFRFDPSATLLLTGTDDDRPLERWWSLGERGRRAAARNLARLGVRLATVPNFSLFSDRPRQDDLHSIKRIGTVWQEMASEGLPAAVHVNARTEDDWTRWAEFVAERSEIDTVAYEFATGAGRADRSGWHAEGLAKFAAGVGRPMRLVVRGMRELPGLARVFDSVTLFDTTAFLKTIKRQQAVINADGSLSWRGIRTGLGQPIDDLFDHNFRAVTAQIVATMAKGG